jgi:hypothetical protein
MVRFSLQRHFRRPNRYGPLHWIRQGRDQQEVLVHQGPWTEGFLFPDWQGKGYQGHATAPPLQMLRNFVLTRLFGFLSFRMGSRCFDYASWRDCSFDFDSWFRVRIFLCFFSQSRFALTSNISAAAMEWTASLLGVFPVMLLLSSRLSLSASSEKKWKNKSSLWRDSLFTSHIHFIVTLYKHYHHNRSWYT